MPRHAGIDGAKDYLQNIKDSKAKSYIEDYYSSTIDSVGGMKKIKAIFSDVVKFSSRLLDIKLYDYQEKILKDDSKKVVINSGRRIGENNRSFYQGPSFCFNK